MRSVEAETGRESIIRAAFRVFGEGGIESTSLREVARAAGVSPALVVHHFGGKEGLVAATDEAAVSRFGDAYRGGGEAQDMAGGKEERDAPRGRAEDDGHGVPPGDGGDLLRERAAQTARVMAEMPEVCAYLGRALVEGTEGSAALFRLMVEGGREEVDALAEAGALRPDVDRTWATLQHFFLIWAPLSFMPLLEGVLGDELLSPSQLGRWVEANVQLLEQGLYS